MARFNVLDYRLCLSPIETPPEESAWQEHIPFARLLTELLRPRVFVELGVHTGASYLAFCQAVVALGLPCSCYGVDTFAGDEHAGSYGRDIEGRLRTRHDGTYGGFSRIITSTFDDAVGHLGDGTIDLLHIDGLHTYEAVAHDFATWSTKLSGRAVVLFHDINVRERGFGVWRLWEELSARHPHFAFRHGHGLGVLAVGGEIPEGLAPLLALEADEAGRVGDLFFLLGNRVTQQVQMEQMRRMIGSLEGRLQAAEAQSARRADEVEIIREHLSCLQNERLEEESAIAALRRENERLRGVIDQLNHSVSFRLGMGATAPLRWFADRLATAKGT